MKSIFYVHILFVKKNCDHLVERISLISSLDNTYCPYIKTVLVFENSKSGFEKIFIPTIKPNANTLYITEKMA